jgi:hypothetical protein
MTITTTKAHRPGVRFFRVLSDSGREYVVAHVRRPGENRWTCNCADFAYRRQMRRRAGRYCKHITATIKENFLAFHFTNRKLTGAL